MNINLSLFLLALFGLIIAGLIGVMFIFGNSRSSPDVAVSNFDECVAANNLIMESYPRQCRASDGRTFVEDIGNELDKVDLIRIDSPRPNQIINSPLAITGSARGYWFFEGDFPIKLLDEDGVVISTAIARAGGEWMTEDFVSFRADLEFSSSTIADRGMLVLERDNPSGLLENADELRIPIYFKK